ncbi:FkbM family methyltransferase [Gammaproteobacteria bacterium]|nr:FkbM family methyltransferase [Gammaproteobacteria bacterium]
MTLDKYFLKNNLKNIDILILDVEGYEIEVLEGYKRGSKIIKYLLVEAWNFNKFNEYAEARGWEFIKKIGNDYLYNLSN